MFISNARSKLTFDYHYYNVAGVFFSLQDNGEVVKYIPTVRKTLMALAGGRKRGPTQSSPKGMLSSLPVGGATKGKLMPSFGRSRGKTSSTNSRDRATSNSTSNNSQRSSSGNTSDSDGGASKKGKGGKHKAAKKPASPQKARASLFDMNAADDDADDSDSDDGDTGGGGGVIGAIAERSSKDDDDDDDDGDDLSHEEKIERRHQQRRRAKESATASTRDGKMYVGDLSISHVTDAAMAERTAAETQRLERARKFELQSLAHLHNIEAQYPAIIRKL
jgi:hypothetical protein